MARQIELIASYWTIAGDVYAGGPTEVSPFDFRERIETAAKVGYTGVGLLHADLMAVSERIGFPAMKRILDDNGMKHIEVEIIGDWFTGGERRARSDKVRADLLRAAEYLAPRHIKICGDLQAADWPLQVLADSLRVLSDEAVRVGTRIAIEIMPFTSIKTVSHGRDILRAAGEHNCGLMFDIWHIMRGGIALADVAAFPKELLYWVELNDADAEPVGTLWEDTLFRRRLCGEGAFDIAGFLRAIRATGYDGPYGVEIISKTHRRLPLAVAAARAFETAMRQFAPNG